jgi:branched-chain amino acid transport system substrate-binding protein
MTLFTRLGTAIAMAVTVATLVQMPVAKAEDPIKVGVLYPLAGVLGVMGRGSANAVSLAFDEEGNRLGAHPVQVLVEDDEGKIDVSLTKLRKLVELEHVDMVFGTLLTNLGIADRDYLFDKKVLWLPTNAAASLTRDKKGPNIFRAGPSNFQWGGASAKYLKERKGWSKIVLIGSNYAAPREAFRAVDKIYGDGVVEHLWPAFGTIDFAPYLSKLDGVSADGAFVAVWGTDALKLIPQYDDYGLEKKIPIFGGASFTTEEYLQGMPAQIEGVSSAFVYCGTLETPENKKFVDGYRAKFGSDPGSYQYLAYVAAKMVITALKEVSYNSADHEALSAALAKVRIEGPMGPVFFDENHGLVSDMFAMTVRTKDGKRINECIDRIPQVADDYSLN